MASRRIRGAGGQSARRAARTNLVIDTAKYIERNIPNFEIMNLESIEIIEEKAEEVLENIGVKFLDNPNALKLWKEAGADISGELVKIYKYKDYDEYRETQIYYNKKKIDKIWADEKTLKTISDFLSENIQTDKIKGICHGSRNGFEQKYFNENNKDDQG